MKAMQREDFLNEYYDYHRMNIEKINFIKGCKKLKKYSENVLENVRRYFLNEETKDGWQMLIDVLEADSKLQILDFFVNRSGDSCYFEKFEMTEEDLINMMEKDYKQFYLESMGYKLNEKPISSFLYILAYQE